MTTTALEAASYGRGLAPIGATFGSYTVVGYSDTAYEVDGTTAGRWVSFDQVHGKPQPATGLVTFADGSRYTPKAGR